MVRAGMELPDQEQTSQFVRSVIADAEWMRLESDYSLVRSHGAVALRSLRALVARIAADAIERNEVGDPRQLAAAWKLASKLPPKNKLPTDATLIVEGALIRRAIATLAQTLRKGATGFDRATGD